MRIRSSLCDWTVLVLYWPTGKQVQAQAVAQELCVWARKVVRDVPQRSLPIRELSAGEVAGR